MLDQVFSSSCVTVCAIVLSKHGVKNDPGSRSLFKTIQRPCSERKDGREGDFALENEDDVIVDGEGVADAT